MQKINLFNKAVVFAFTGLFALVASLIVYFSQLTSQALAEQSSLMGNLLIFSTLVCFILVAAKRKINVYDSFIEGAKQGFETSIKLIPIYLQCCALLVF